MSKSSKIKLGIAIALIAIISVAVFPVMASGDDEAKDYAIIKDYYEENRDRAASLGIALINMQDTRLFYLGDIEDDPDYVFEWGSCTKVITWVSVMQLFEQGKIDLNADIKTYLPKGFLTRLKYKEPLTMLNLMNHNAGFQEMDHLFVEDKAELKTLSEALKQYQPPQIRKPGEVVAYSNYGVALAGYIVERVSGEDFGDYIHNNIFTPLSMEHTAIKSDHSDNDWVVKRREGETCYFIPIDGEKIDLGSSYLFTTIYPAGAACGTVADFAKFVRALIPDKNNKCPLFAKDDTLNLMYEPTLYYADGTPRNAHGMWAEQIGNGLFGHGGNSAGFSSNFLIDPTAQKAYAVMTNVAGEFTFNHKPLPVIFGDYEWGSEGLTISRDISGRYFPMRDYYPHSFKKFGNSAVSGGRLDITQHKGDFRLTWPGLKEYFPVTWISDRLFLMDDGIMPQYFFVGDNGVLQGGAMDWHLMSNVIYYGEWALFILLVLSGSFAVVILIAKGCIFIIKRKRKMELPQIAKERFHLISLGLIAATGLFIYLMAAVSLLSRAPDDVPKMIGFGLLATASAVTAFVFGILQLKSNDLSKRIKILRIATLLTSATVLANTLYWELFNFWSL